MQKRAILQSTDKQFHQDSELMYQSIVSQPVEFAVMNDYTRTVTTDILSTYVTFLARQKYQKPRRYITDYIWITMESHGISHYFHIMEDFGVDGHKNKAPGPCIDYFPLEGKRSLTRITKEKKEKTKEEC